MTSAHDSRAGRRRKQTIAPPGAQFVAYLREMLESPPWRVLSLSARRVFDRICIELRAHRGYVGDGLCITYDDFQEYGIDRHSIRPAINELIALGFIVIIRQGRSGNREFRQATLYRPTCVVMLDVEQTHEWRRIKSIEHAVEVAAEARKPDGPKRSQKPVLEKRTGFGGKEPTTNAQNPSAKFLTTAAVKSHTTSDISHGVGGRAGDGGAMSAARHDADVADIRYPLDADVRSRIGRARADGRPRQRVTLRDE